MQFVVPVPDLFCGVVFHRAAVDLIKRLPHFQPEKVLFRGKDLFGINLSPAVRKSLKAAALGWSETPDDVADAYARGMFGAKTGRRTTFGYVMTTGGI